MEGQELTEHARKIKNANELNAMRCAIASCEEAMRRNARPEWPTGIMTEVELAGRILQYGNHHSRRRVDRDPDSLQRAAHQSVVPGMPGRA